MNPTDAEIAGKLQAIINSINENTHWAWIKDELRFILRNLDAEPPKPTGDQLKRTCGNCGMPAKDCGVSKFSREACESVPAWCKNWTPKEPEPAAKLNHHNFSSRPCSTCGWMNNGLCECTIECHGNQWKLKEPKAEPTSKCHICRHNIGNCLLIVGKCDGIEKWEPKAAPGLVSFPIEEQEERWWVIYGEGRDDCCTLSEIFDGVSVHHIELKSGATVTTLQAFDENDPPVRAWFRK